MRLGISTVLAHETPEQWAKQLSDLGCGAVVFPVNHDAGDSLIQQYADAAAKYDLLIAEVGVWCNPIARDKKTREDALAYAQKQLALADKIGARCCVNITGSAGAVWDGAYKENFSADVYAATVQSIQDIIDAVHPKNTYYTIEPMPWMTPLDPDDYLRLIKDVNRERFAVHMDIFNWITSPRKYFFNEEFIEECFGKLGKYVRSCHLKDVNLGSGFTFQMIETYCGGGNINLKKYTEAATAADPDMPVLIEHLHSETQYLASLAYVKELLK